MNIGFLTTEYPGLTPTGGIGTSIRNLGRALKAVGVEVTIYLISDRKSGRCEIDGLAISAIQTRRGYPMSGMRTRMMAAATINYDYLAGRLDALEVPDWGGITAMMPLLCPVIVRCHGSETYFAHLDRRPVRMRTYMLEAAALRTARSVLSVSAYAADITAELFNLFDRDIGIVQNCVPKEYLEADMEQNEAKRERIIAYVGTLVRKKGVFEIPGIFNKVHEYDHEVRLVLAGRDNPDGHSMSTWQCMQKMFTPSALDKVSYRGVIPYDQVRTLLRTASVCIFPSFAEAFPLSWLEAMASRSPVVASDIGWAHEMIKDGVTGYLVPPNDHVAYAGRILQLLADPALASRMGQEAREYVHRHFSGDVVAQRSLAVYRAFV